jgi:tripartite-type tricarboxylate transporter receptor subunit TctC
MDSLHRTSLLYLFALSSSLFCFAHIVVAQPYPGKPIRVIVPYPPGGSTDIIARIVGQKLTETWGIQVIIDNRPGASGMIGTDIVAKSLSDGYSLVTVASSHVLHPSLYRQVPFNTINDFTQVIMLVRSPNLICVHPSLPVRSIRELVALARTRPGTLVYGIGGLGSSNHLGGEMFKSLAKIDITPIPYKGSGPALIDAIGGQIPMLIQTTTSAGPSVKAGKLRALAVTSKARYAAFADVPTLDESGFPGFDSSEWWGLLGPAGIAKDVVAKLNAEIDRIMNRSEVQTRFAEIGTSYIGGTPEEAGAFFRSEMAKWSKVAQAAGLKPE